MAKRKRRRPRSRVTLLGFAFVLITLLVLLAAWNTGINLLYIVVGGLLSFLVITLAITGRNLRSIVVTRESPYSVERGQEFSVRVRIENRKPFFPALSLRLVSHSRPEESSGYILRIPSRRAAATRIVERFAKRGVYPLPPLEVVSTFPFGLMETRLVCGDDNEVIVHPRVVSVRTGWSDQMPGTGDTPRRSDVEGDEFFCLRMYVPGDDVRRISWRASARLGEFVVRELEPDLSRYVIFLLDTYLVPHMEDFEERFEQVIEMTASLAVTLLNRNYAVSVVTPRDGVQLGEGRSHGLVILDMLARVKAEEGREKPYHLWPTFNEPRRASYIGVSPNPTHWGRKGTSRTAAVLDPREIIRA